MVRAVLINERRGDIRNINVDMDPEKNEIYKILRGRATFIGQWPELNVVILRCDTSLFELNINNNKLPRPFTNLPCIRGKILLIRMDDDAEPRDFTVSEYKQLITNASPQTRLYTSSLFR